MNDANLFKRRIMDDSDHVELFIIPEKWDISGENFGVRPFSEAKQIDITELVNQDDLRIVTDGGSVRVSIKMVIPTINPLKDCKIKLQLVMARETLDCLSDENYRNIVLDELYWIICVHFHYMEHDQNHLNTHQVPVWVPQQM